MAASIQKNNISHYWVSGLFSMWLGYLSCFSFAHAESSPILPNSKDIATLNQLATIYWHENYYFADIYHWQFEEEESPDLACLVNMGAVTIEEAQCTTQYEDISYLKLEAAIGLPVEDLRTEELTDEAFMFMPDRIIDARQIKQWRANRYYLLTTLSTTEANLDSLTLCTTYFSDGEVDIDGSFCRAFPEDSMQIFELTLIGTTLTIEGEHEGYRYQYEYKVGDDQLRAIKKTPNWYVPMVDEPIPVCWQIGAFRYEYRAEKLAEIVPQGLYRDIATSLQGGRELFHVFVGPKAALTPVTQQWLNAQFPDKFPRRCTYRLMYNYEYE